MNAINELPNINEVTDTIKNTTETVTNNVQSTVSQASEQIKQTTESAKELIKNPKSIVENMKNYGLWKIGVIVFVGILIIVILTRLYNYYKTDSRNVSDILNNELAFNLWQNSPMSTMGTFKTNTDEIYAPSSDDNQMTYTMLIKVIEWDPTHSNSKKELFHHGMGECCDVKKNDIINVQFDGEKNDILINVKTQKECETSINTYNAHNVATGKNRIWMIANKANQTNKLYTRKNDGSDCWSHVRLPNISDQIKDIDVVSYPSFLKKSDDIFIMITKNTYTSVYKIIFIDLDKTSLLPIVENEYNCSEFSAVLIDNENYNTIRFTFRDDEDRTFYSDYNIKNNTSSDIKYETTNNLSLPISTKDSLYKINDTGTLFKCKKPCNDNSYEIDGDYNYNFKSISSDENKLWGLTQKENSSQKIYSKENDSDDWLLVKNTIVDDPIESIDSPYDSNSKLWAIKNKKINSISKCTRVNINEPINDCSNEDNKQNHAVESISLKNIPIGEPFHLAITLTSKRCDVYLNGKLENTKIFEGKRPSESQTKQFRFFGTQSRINGMISNFRYLPFPLEVNHIQSLARIETDPILSKKYGCSRGNAYSSNYSKSSENIEDIHLDLHKKMNSSWWPF